MPGENSDIISRLAPDAGTKTVPAAAPLRLDSATGGTGGADGTGGAGGAGGDISVTPSVLRGAAGAAHTIAASLKAPNEQAAAGSRDAASALKGWRFGSLLHAAAGKWHAEYRSVSHQVDLTGSMIADAARGFEWTEDRIVSTFESNES